MNESKSRLIVATSPFVKRAVDTPTVMRHVIYSLIPVILAAVYFFGISALLVIVTCIVACSLTEWLLSGRPKLSESSITDGSAVITAILLALTLPPGLPLWMAALGSIVAIVVGKFLFGGLGNNIFNPSLTGRAFLQASFPQAMTTWSFSSGYWDFFKLRGDNFAIPFLTPNLDAVTAATPLAKMKFEGLSTSSGDLLLGSIPGSIGETCAVLILLGGIYLGVRGFLKWRIPVGILATVLVFSGLLHFIQPDTFPTPLHHLLSGGLMLGAVFMATDPVTSPVTPLGCWIFAAGIGIMVVLIRQFGGLPEGVMYSILFMNAMAPLLDRWTQPRVYGAGRRATA